MEDELQIDFLVWHATTSYSSVYQLFLEWCACSGNYKTPILCAGVVKSLAQYIGRPYPGLELTSNLRTCMDVCIISIVAHGKNTKNACTVKMM
jgi:hypothetical protein